MTAPSSRATRLLGALVAAVGLVITAVAWPGVADARGGELRAPTPSALSVLLSAEVVDAKVDAFVIAADDAPHKLAGIGAVLGALPGQVPLLLSPPGDLSDAVAAEVDRIRTDATVAYVIDAPGISAALARRGVAVNEVTGASQADLVGALADQTFGVLAGTGQRLLVTGGDLHVAGLAATMGANLGIPVVPLAGPLTGDVLLREVLVVADVATVPDAWIVAPGDPAITRVAADDLDQLGVALGQRLAGEPRDGDLAERIGRSAIVLDAGEQDPHPALLASVVAAADALDGLDATVRVLPRGQAPTDAEGLQVTRIGLGTPGVAPAHPSSSPLPATGGGLVLGAGLALIAWAPRRR